MKRALKHMDGQATAQRLEQLGGARGFVFLEDQNHLSYGLHAHSRHQLLYALEGTGQLEVEDAIFLLPPQRAAFIPAGVRHVTTVRSERIASVFLAKKLVPHAPAEVRVFSATPLLREMIDYAARWSAGRDPHDRTANLFFACLGKLTAEWLATRDRVGTRLPRGKSQEVRALVAYLGEHLSDATLERAAQHVGSSTRTLRRKLYDELGTSFRELAAQARLLRAMELLCEPDQNVTSVAFGLGYDSLSAFSRRFARFAGETPSAYRERVKLSPRAAPRAPRPPRRA